MLAKAPYQYPKRTKLTDDLAKRLPLVPKGSRPPQVVVSDEEQTGFALVIGLATKTFRARVEVWAGGVRQGERSQEFGRVGEVKVKDARRAAAKWIIETRTGARIASRRGGATLRAVWERFQVAPKRRGGARQPSGLEWYRGIVERGPLKAYLDKPISALTPEVIADLHYKATRAGNPYKANGLARAARALYNFARKHVDRTLPREDIADAVVWNEEHRAQDGMAAKDLAAWGDEVAALPNRIRALLNIAVQLTGSRPNALVNARWDDIDRRRRVLHLRVVKGGPRMAFDVPLSRPLIRLLVLLCRVGQKARHGSPWLFPAHSAVGHIVEWKETRKADGKGASLSKFGKQCRQTFRTLAQDVGVSETTAHLLMGHRLPGINAGYMNRDKLNEGLLRAQQQRLSEYIVRNLGPQWAWLGGGPSPRA